MVALKKGVAPKIIRAHRGTPVSTILDLLLGLLHTLADEGSITAVITRVDILWIAVATLVQVGVVGVTRQVTDPHTPRSFSKCVGSRSDSTDVAGIIEHPERIDFYSLNFCNAEN